MAVTEPITFISFDAAAKAFRTFFAEVNAAFLERETLLTQIELGLLCREHVLVVGPPGTAKSALASAVLGRIVDSETNRPSLFSKQLAENTVQTDLIGAVDFKVLTETGRTEYLTDEGMLGSTHAFLDEVFDGRDMRLRSVLNVLHERELKHGKKVTRGRCECAVMTSNRYLSEVLQRSPETLQAFADRISFICFTPKSFVRPSSRAQMIRRSHEGQRPRLVERLTLQDLDTLQSAVEKVEVPPAVSEGLEALADSLEAELLAQVTKLPDYVPTKYFSQRSLVKAVWALKAAVVRDQIHRRPERPAVAELEDLSFLRNFFLLGGPTPAEVEVLLKTAIDPRERAQLEIIRVEHRAFDDAFKRVAGQVSGGVSRENESLAIQSDERVVSQLDTTWSTREAAAATQSLLAKAVPGPRHSENRAHVLRVASVLITTCEQRMSRGVTGDLSSLAMLFALLADVFQFAQRVPELRPRLKPFADAALKFTGQASEFAVVAAEGLTFEPAMASELLLGQTRASVEYFARLRELAQLASTVATAPPRPTESVLAEHQLRTARALRATAQEVFSDAGVDSADRLNALGRRLREFENAVVALDSGLAGLTAKLIQPLGAGWARVALAQPGDSRLQSLVAAIQLVIDSLRNEGVDVNAALTGAKEQLATRLAKTLKTLQQAPRNEEVTTETAMNGAALETYRKSLASDEGNATEQLEKLNQLLQPLGGAPRPLREAVNAFELARLNARITFLQQWFAAIRQALPEAKDLTASKAERTFLKLVESRFPQLVTREGELIRLSAVLTTLSQQEGDPARAAATLNGMVHELAGELRAYADAVLAVRRAR